MDTKRFEGHTPGPWEMTDRLDDRDNPCGIDIVSATEEIICRLPDGASTKGGHCWPEQIYNGRLLAAAPDLLAENERLREALSGLLDYTGGWDLVDPEHPIVAARAALEGKDNA